jgi:chromosomal replication initiation ATPase DnaA
MYEFKDIKTAIELTKLGLSEKEIKKFFNFENKTYTNPYDILYIICDYFKVHPKIVTSDSREPLHVLVRKYVSYFACKKFKIIQKEVAFILKKDRTVLVHYNKSIQDWIDIKDKETLEHIKNIKKLLT